MEPVYWSIAVTPDGGQVVSAGHDGTVRVWDLAYRRLFDAPLFGHGGPVLAVAVTPDGSQVVSGGEDGTVRVWNNIRPAWSDKPLISDPGPFWTVAVSPDSRQIISADLGWNVRMWDRATGQPVGPPLTGHTDHVRAVAVTPDGTRIISTGDDRTVRIWDRAAGRSIDSPLTGHANAIRAIAVTPDCAQVVSASTDHTVRIWDLASCQPVGHPLVGHTDHVRALAVTPDGVHIVSASDDGTVRIWERATGFQVGEPLAGHNGRVNAVAVTPDGAQIVSAGDDGMVRIWDRVTAQLAGPPLAGHIGEVWGIAVTPDGSRIVSAGNDRSVRVWHRASGQQSGPPLIGHAREVCAVAVTPDGSQIISASNDGTIRTWDLSTGEQLRQFPASLAAVVTDLETVDDRLGITGDVNTVAAIIAAMSTKPPLSVALLGDWGTGKSSFMRQVQDRVAELSAQSAQLGRQGVFAANVRQVRFNAWHYSDDHLWVGLVEHLFRELAKPAADPDGPATSEISDLKARLSTRKAERDRLETGLQAVDRVYGQGGWLDKVLAPFRSVTLARAVLGGVWRELRSYGWIVLVALVVFLVGCAGVVLADAVLKWLSGTVALLAVLLGPVLATWRWFSSQSFRLRMQLEERRSEVNNEIRNVEAELSKFDPALRLHRLLAEISTAERYEGYRGLTGRIHQDLGRLSADLAAAHSDWERGHSIGLPPLQRIVLYVDDLDRCTPGRVVGVLQAVNLLLTMDLFIVVVAVDPRWLLRSLEVHHERLFDDNAVAYLDKIFHIPFALRPMGDHAVGYLRSLLPSAEEPTPQPIPRQESLETEIAFRSIWDTTEGSAEGPERPVPQPVAAAKVPTWHLATHDLRLRTSEREFLARLTPLVSTPRAVKKLVNLYRLLRTGIPEDKLRDFVGTDQAGPFQAAALLLAALVGAPHEMRSLLTELATVVPGDDIVDALSDSSLSTRLRQLIVEIRKDVPVHGDITTYQRWARTVARYGFETYDLFTG